MFFIRKEFKNQKIVFRNKPNYATPPGVVNAGGNKSAGGDDEE